MIPVSEQMLVARFTGDNASPGQRLQCDFSRIPLVKDGKHAHVRSLSFWTSVELVTTAGGETNDVTARHLRSLISDISLRDLSGHWFFQGLDGRDLLDDNFFYSGGLSQISLPKLFVGGDSAATSDSYVYFPQVLKDFGLAASVADGSHIRNISFRWQATRRTGSPTDGFIPVAALTRGSAGDASLEFTLRNSIPGVNANVAVQQYNSLTVSGAKGIDVYAEIVWLDAIVLDAPFTVDTYNVTESVGSLRRPDSITEYAVQRFREEDAANFAGLGLAGAVTRVTVDVAGVQVIDSQSAAETLLRHVDMMSARDGSAWRERDASSDLPLIQQGGTYSGNLAALVLSHSPTRENAARGRISYRFEDALTTHRFLHRTVGASSEARRQKILANANCGCPKSVDVMSEKLATCAEGDFATRVVTK